MFLKTGTKPVVISCKRKLTSSLKIWGKPPVKANLENIGKSSLVSYKTPLKLFFNDGRILHTRFTNKYSFNMKKELEPTLPPSLLLVDPFCVGINR